METQGMALLLAVVAIMAISLFAAGCTQGGSNVPASQGRAVLTVADAATNMGSITSIKMTLDSVQVQSAAQGWITISSTPTTYDLLQLKASGANALLADSNLTPGIYGQIRLHISKVVVTDSNGDHDAKLPSGDLKIVGGFVVANNSTSVVMLDFLADRSLHITGNGRYIMAPVLHMQELKDAQVDTRSRWDVKVWGGRVGTDTEFGMDENGTFGEGRSIPLGANVTIENDGRIRIHPMMRGNSGIEGNGGNSEGWQPYYSNVSGQNISDLTACTAISEQQARLSCIAQWCGSENRDHNKCYGLTDMDDQLGCLSKCNPNPNR